MKILITNDDGIDSEGLKTLCQALREKDHEIFVVAPKENNSAVSHKLTMRSAVPFEKRSDHEYAVGGTPADCVLIAISYFKIKPDVVLSGINTGVNMGSDVIYSGTVAGALEGAQNGFPSLALSQFLHRQDSAETITSSLRRAAKIISERLPQWVKFASLTGAVNVNFPPCEPLGFRVCKQARSHYNTSYRAEADGLHMELHSHEPIGEGDISVLKSGYVTLSPLQLDYTDYKAIEQWEKLQ